MNKICIILISYSADNRYRGLLYTKLIIYNEIVVKFNFFLYCLSEINFSSNYALIHR